MRSSCHTRWLALAVVPLLGVAACGDGDDTETATTGTEPATTVAPSTATSAPGPTTTASSPSTTAGNGGGGGGIDPMPDADTETKSGPAASGFTPLTDVRTARHEGYDRVTFEFRGPAPGYTVGYQERPILSDGEGAEVDVAGAAVLVARFEPSSSADYEADYEPVYTGPTRIPGEGSTITEVVGTGDFEAVLTWAIGVEAELDFRVDVLEDPNRIVIDVRNH